MSGKSSSIKRLQKLPREPLFNSYSWVDYIELLSLFSIDEEITKADFLRHFNSRKDVGEDPSDQDEVQDEAEEQDEVDEEISVAEAKDRTELRIDDWFRHFDYRLASFGHFYPFVLTKTQDVLRLRSPLTLRHKLYLFLLLASNLTYFAQHQTRLTGSFEHLSVEALKRLLPSYAEVRFVRQEPAKWGTIFWKSLDED